MIPTRVSRRLAAVLYWLGVLAPGLFVFTSLYFGWSAPWSPPTTWLGPALSAAMLWRASASAKGRAIHFAGIPLIALLAFAVGVLLADRFGPHDRPLPD